MNLILKKNMFLQFEDMVREISTTIIGRIIIAAAVFLIFYALSKILPKAISHAVYRMPDYRNLKDTAGVLKAVIRFVNWVIAIIIILDILGLDGVFTKVIASAGIVGMIAGFALKDVSSNGFAGLLIKAQRPFQVGDWVKIAGYMGVVREISTITVGIETVGGQMVYVPNQNIYNNAFENLTRFGHFRVIVEMGISYGDDLAHVEQVAMRTLKSLSCVDNPEDVDFYFVNVGSCTYNFNARYLVKFTDQKSMLKAQSEGIKALKQAFEKENICVAYNVTTLDFNGKGGVNLDETSLRIISETELQKIEIKEDYNGKEEKDNKDQCSSHARQCED